MGKAARQECPEGQGRALDEEERRELLRLQEPPRRGQGAQADPQMGCNPRGRARQSEARGSARSLQHRQRGMGGQRLPLEPDRGEPEGEGLAEPYPSARRSQSSAVRAPEVGEHDALEGARPCRARIRPAAELDGRQDCAHHWHRAGEVQDWHDEPRLQHPPAGSARADGSCTRLSALTGGLRVPSCKGPRGCRLGVKTVPDRGLTSAQALQPLAQLRQKSPKASIVRGSLKAIKDERIKKAMLEGRGRRKVHGWPADQKLADMRRELLNAISLYNFLRNVDAEAKAWWGRLKAIHEHATALSKLLATDEENEGEFTEHWRPLWPENMPPASELVNKMREVVEQSGWLEASPQNI